MGWYGLDRTSDFVEVNVKDKKLLHLKNHLALFVGIIKRAGAI
jgi:hypothetical protein